MRYEVQSSLLYNKTVAATSISDRSMRVLLLKRKKILTQGRTFTSNPDLSYPNLSTLVLHYHNDQQKFQKN